MNLADLFQQATVAERAAATYLSMGDDLLIEAAELTDKGFTHWAAEVRDWAVIANHAAWAELTRPDALP